MYYFFTLDFTVISIEYINIYSYSNEYIFIYNYDILNEIYTYIYFLLLKFNFFIYDFQNIYLNYIVFFNITNTIFCGIMLDLNSNFLTNQFLIYILNTIILLVDNNLINFEIKRNLFIYLLLPHNSLTIVPIWAYYDLFYNLLIEFNLFSFEYVYFSYILNWLFYIILELSLNYLFSYLFYCFFSYFYIYLYFYLFIFIIFFFVSIYLKMENNIQIDYIYILFFYLDQKIKRKFFLYGFFYNPIFLYKNKKEKEANYLWADIRTKTKLSLLKIETLDITFIHLYNLIKYSYKRYLIFLQIMLLSRLIFTCFYFFIYFFKFVLKYFFYFFFYYFIIIKYIWYIYIFIYTFIYSYLKYSLILQFFTKLVYIFFEFFIFINQQTIPINYYIINLINFFKPKYSIYINNKNITKGNIFDFIGLWYKKMISIFLYSLNYYYIDLKIKKIKIFIFFSFLNNFISYLYLTLYKYNIILYIIKWLFFFIFIFCCLKINIINYNFFIFIIFIFIKIRNIINLNYFYYFFGFISYYIFSFLLFFFTIIVRIFYLFFIKFKIIYILFFYLFFFVLQLDMLFFIKHFFYYILQLLLIEINNYLFQLKVNYLLWYNLFSFSIIRQDILISNLQLLLDLIEKKNELISFFRYSYVEWKLSENKWLSLDLDFEQFFQLLNISILWNFLIYDLEINKWFTFDFTFIKNYFLINIYIYLLPNIGWLIFDNIIINICWYIYQHILLYIIYIFCCVQYIYYYIIPSHIFKYIYLYYIYIYPLIFYIRLHFLQDIILSKIIILNLFSLFKFFLYLLLNNIYFYIFNIINLFVLYLYLCIYEMFTYCEFFKKFLYYNIDYFWSFFYINIFYEFQTNIDSICNYYRINRFNIYKWTKRSKKFGFKWNVTPIRWINLETVILHKIIKFKNPSGSSTILSNDSGNYLMNVNILLKYLKIKAISKEFSKLYYINIIKYQFLLTRQSIYYFFVYYFLFYIIFKCWFNFYNTKFSYNYNTQYLWTLLRKDTKFLKNFEFEHLSNLEKYLKIYKLKNTSKKKINNIFELFTKNYFFKFIIILKELNNNFSFFKYNINSLKNLKINKTYINTLQLYLPKLLKKNFLIMEFIYNVKFVYYNFIYTQYTQYLNFFLAYLYKKNNYVPFICKQEIFLEEEPLKENLEFLSKKIKENQYKFMWRIYIYFDFIDNILFNKKGPNWLLNKNQFTIFLNNKIENEKNTIFIYYSLPYEKEFFFLCIIVFLFFFMFLHYGLTHVMLKLQRIQELKMFFNILLNNIYFFWKMYIYFFNIFDTLTGFKFNLNGSQGVKYNIIYIYMWSYKYTYLDLCGYYKLLDFIIVNINLIDYLKIDFISNNWYCYQLLLFFFLLYFFLYFIIIIIKYIYNNIYIYLLYTYIYDISSNIISSNIKKNILNNIIKHFKFKYYLWNNYLKK